MGTRRSMWRFIAADRFVGLFLFSLGFISIPYFVPLLQEFRDYAHYYGEPVLYCLIMIAFQHGRGSLKSKTEQKFWNYLTIPFALWAIVRVLTVTDQERWDDTFFAFGADLAYLLFYFFFILASESRPNTIVSEKTTEPETQVKIAGFAIILLGLFCYFIVIPSATQPSAFENFLPSYYMYISLDVILALRFWQLFRRSIAPRWRTIFMFCFLGMSSQALADLWEWFNYAEILPIPWEAWTDFVWDIPLFLFVLAARVRHYQFPEVYDTSPQEPIIFKSSLVFMAFSFPVFHFILSRLNLMDPVSAPFREIVAYTSMGILGALAALEHHFLQKKTRKLELERSLVRNQADQRTAFMNSLIAGSPVAIVVVDNESRIQMCNASFERLFQYKTSEILGGNVDDLITTKETREEAVEITRKVREGKSIQMEGIRNRKDGSQVYVFIHGIPSFMHDRLIGIFVMYQDVSEMKKAQAALRESEERFRQASEVMPLGMFIFGEDLRILDYNRSFLQMLGRKAGDLQDKTIRELTDPDDWQKEESLMKNLMKFEIPQYKMVKRHLREGKEPVWTDVTVTTIRNQDGIFLYGLALVEDITERRILEDRLARTHRLEAVGQLAGGIAHDFNNLLTVILGNAEFLKGQVEGADTQLMMTKEILNAAERAASLTQQLLAFSRRTPLSPKVLSLNSTIAEIEPMLRRLIGENIQLTIDLENDVWMVEADPAKLEQVLMNLVLNARDAIPSNGKITISTKNVKLDDAYAFVHPPVVPGKFVCLSVTDDGRGMDSKTLSRIFEPFFSTKEKGTGLGLSTVYGIVKQSSGFVWAYSEPGMGTEVKVYLPQVEREQLQAEEVPDQPLLHKSETILLVEDEASVRSLARRILQASGYHVLEAGTPQNALKLCSDYKFNIDLLLTDVVMPEMLGPELAEKVIPLHPETRILYMSGYAGKGAFHPKGHSSAINFVEKPFSREVLLRQIRGVLDARSDVGLQPRTVLAHEGSVSKVEQAKNSPKSILIVDDHEAVRNALASIIQTNGYTVCQASSTQEAIEVAKKSNERISLLITDINLPGGSGIELAQTIAKKNPELSILLISGYPLTQEDTESLPQGSAFIQKPFRMNVILERIQELIGPATA